MANKKGVLNMRSKSHQRLKKSRQKRLNIKKYKVLKVILSMVIIFSTLYTPHATAGVLTRDLVPVTAEYDYDDYSVDVEVEDDYEEETVPPVVEEEYDIPEDADGEDYPVEETEPETEVEDEYLLEQPDAEGDDGDDSSDEEDLDLPEDGFIGIMPRNINMNDFTIEWVGAVVNGSFVANPVQLRFRHPIYYDGFNNCRLAFGYTFPSASLSTYFLAPGAGDWFYAGLSFTELVDEGQYTMGIGARSTRHFLSAGGSMSSEVCDISLSSLGIEELNINGANVGDTFYEWQLPHAASFNFIVQRTSSFVQIDGGVNTEGILHPLNNRDFSHSDHNYPNRLPQRQGDVPINPDTVTVGRPPTGRNTTSPHGGGNTVHAFHEYFVDFIIYNVETGAGAPIHSGTINGVGDNGYITDTFSVPNNLPPGLYNVSVTVRENTPGQFANDPNITSTSTGQFLIPTELEIGKIDYFNAAVPGALFELTRMSNIIIPDATFGQTYSGTTTSVSTDPNDPPAGTVSFTGLLPGGTYRLREIGAPPGGFVLPPAGYWEWEVTVGLDGEITSIEPKTDDTPVFGQDPWRVMNERASFEFTKFFNTRVDGEMVREPLRDAQFTLRRISDGTPQCPPMDDPAYHEATSGANGLISFEHLWAGCTYRLDEVQAPDEPFYFMTPTGHWEIEIDAYGVVTINTIYDDPNDEDYRPTPDFDEDEDGYFWLINLPYAPILSIEKLVNGQDSVIANIGETLTYTITVRNEGRVNAYDIWMIDDLSWLFERYFSGFYENVEDIDVEFNFITPPIPPRPLVSSYEQPVQTAGNILRIDFPVLGAGEEAVITFQTVVVAGRDGDSLVDEEADYQAIVNTARLFEYDADGEVYEVYYDDARVRVLILELEKLVNGYNEYDVIFDTAEDALFYTIRVTNRSDFDAPEGFVVRDDLSHLVDTYIMPIDLLDVVAPGAIGRNVASGSIVTVTLDEIPGFEYVGSERVYAYVLITIRVNLLEGLELNGRSFVNVAYLLNPDGSYRYEYVYNEEGNRVRERVRDDAKVNLPMLVDLAFIKTNDLGVPLPGAIFQLFECDAAGTTCEEDPMRTVISSLLTPRGEVRFTDLRAGTYRLVEYSAPIGFETPTGHWTITITSTGEITVTPVGDVPAFVPVPSVVNGETIYTYHVENERSTTNFPIRKTDDREAPLQGATFLLSERTVADDGTVTHGPVVSLTTPANGVITFEGLRAGYTYTLREVAPDGFISPTGYWVIVVGMDRSISIIHHGDVPALIQGDDGIFHISNVKYTFDFEFTKTGYSGAPLPGAVFRLFSCTDAAGLNCTTTPITTISSLTDPIGLVEFAGLRAGGTYRLVELVAPTGYVLPTGHWIINVSLDSNGIMTIEPRDGALPLFNPHDANGVSTFDPADPGGQLTFENIPADPELSIEKLVNGEDLWDAQVGETLIYTIRIENAPTALGTARHFRMVDDLYRLVGSRINEVSDITITSANGSVEDYTFENNVLTVYIEYLAPGGYILITLETTAHPDAITHTFVNTAELQDEDGYILTNADGEELYDTATVYVPHLYTELSIAKRSIPTTGTATEPVIVERGSEITYIISVENDGNIPALNVVVEDNVPAHLTIDALGIRGQFGEEGPLLTLSQLGAAGVVIDVDGQLVTWTIAELADGGLFILHVPTTVNLDTPNPLLNSAPTFINQAFITDHDDMDEDDRNNDRYASDITYHEVEYINPALAISKDSYPQSGTAEAPEEVDRGSEIVYSISVANVANGDNGATAPAFNVVVEDVIPAHLIIAQAGIMGQFNGGPLLTLSELGAQGVVVNVDGQTVTWTIAELGIGETFTLVIPTTVDLDTPNNTVFINYAVITEVDGEEEDIPSNNVYHEVEYLYTKLLIEKTATPESGTSEAPEVVERGSEIIYSISVANDGNTPAFAVVVEDDIPLHLTIDELGIRGQFGEDGSLLTLSQLGAQGVVIDVDGQLVTWTIAELEDGAVFILHIPTTVNNNTPDGTTFINYAVITEADGEEKDIPSNNVYHEAEEFDLELTKEVCVLQPATGLLGFFRNLFGRSNCAFADKVAAEIGDTIRYRLTVENLLDSLLQDFVVEDVLDLDLVQLGIDGLNVQINGVPTDAYTFDELTGVLRVYLAELSPLGVYHITFDVIVLAGNAEDEIPNTAYLYGPADENGDRDEVDSDNALVIVEEEEPTTVPETTVPETTTPTDPEETTVPETTTPTDPEETTVPETTTPTDPEETTVPETTTPTDPEETTVPETTTPTDPEETTVPETTTPTDPEETTVPDTTAPTEGETVAPTVGTEPETTPPTEPETTVPTTPTIPTVPEATLPEEPEATKPNRPNLPQTGAVGANTTLAGLAVAKIGGTIAFMRKMKKNKKNRFG